MTTRTDTANRLLHATLALIVALGSIIPVAALWGWSVATLWEWFIVPAFALPAISAAQAIGLSLVVSLLAKNPQKPEKDDDGIWFPVFKEIAKAAFRPLFAVAVGWVYLQVFF
jgi:hypothetical protein